MKGKLIVIDGVDGAGKGEQLRRLEKYLPVLYPNQSFVFTREPGGSPYAEVIRNTILCDEARGAGGAVMAQLFGAARFDHLEKLVLPALDLGKIVISDRFESSTYAFQLIAQGGGYEARHFFTLQRDLFRHWLPSWKTIVLDVSVAIAQYRSRARADQERTHFDERKKSFHEAVRSGFEAYARDFPEAHVSKVDASRSIEEVFKDVLSLVQQEIG
jgi:dTMP kinase